MPVDSSNLDFSESRPSTPSSYGSSLEPFTSASNFRHARHLSQASSISGESSHQWSPILPQNRHGQLESYPGSPLLQSGSGSLPDHFRSPSWPHQDHQLENLKIRCDHLAKRNTALEAKVDTIKYAYEALINRVPALMSSPLGLNVTTPHLPALLSLREEDYPHVSYWTREKWTAREKDNNGISNGGKTGERGGSKLAKGINISMQYVEDANGVAMDGFCVKMILSASHQLFFQLRDLKRHPKTWGAAGTETLRAYCEEMEQKFPELALCADSWKSKHIATQNYSSWYNSHGKATVKAEESDDDDIDIDQPSNKCWSSRGHGKPSKKKKKTAGSESKQEPASVLPLMLSVLKVPVVPITSALTPAVHPLLALPIPNFSPLFGVNTSSTTATATGCDPVVPAALTYPLFMPPMSKSVTPAPSISLIEQPLPSPTVVIAFGQPHVNSASGDVSPFSPPGQNAKPTEPSAPVSVPTPATTDLPDASMAPPNILMAPDVPIVPDVLTAPDVSVALAVLVAPDIPMAPGRLMASDVLTVPDVPSVLPKNTKYVPSKISITPRNLCGRDWCVSNPGGTTTEFSAYWQQIKDTAEEKNYTMLSNAAKDAKKMAASAQPA